MEITPFGPDDEADCADWAALCNAIAAHDAPWEQRQTAKLASARFRHGWDGEPDAPFLCRVDGEAVGWAAVATSDHDNLHAAWTRVQVHPDHRRRGIGTALLDVVLEEVGRRGRTTVGGDAWAADSASAFTGRHGFEAKNANVNRRQFLADVDWPRLQQEYDAALAAAADYELERWPAPTPEGRLDELAVMASAINDAPRGDLDLEDEVFTADRMRAYEGAQAGHDHRLYRVVVRHRPSGELAGHTVVAVSADDPAWGEQHDTSVVRAHRGHRLGLLLKAELLHWLREVEPQLETVDTWNAESNSHMIGVNELLGYRVMGREVSYQRKL
ncbi:MAG TPA: GNAT family N-acetyltransferase [Nocardioides sp.]|nr:GNAT family N-acetyltransferase [Nocardioides sp.]